MREVGLPAWSATYKVKPSDDRHAFDVLYRSFVKRGVSVRPDQLAELLGMAKWIDSACRTIECDEKYFAAMACTSIGATSFVDVKVPWDAFVVRIPGESISVGTTAFDRVLVWTTAALGIERSSEHDAWFKLYPRSHDKEHLGVTQFSPHGISDLLFKTGKVNGAEAGMGNPPEDLSEDEYIRACDSVRRAIVGLLYTMQHTTNFREHPSGKRKPNSRFGPPAHRTILVGRPIEIDCRQALRDFVTKGERSAPSVQSLVRGHYKRQVVGTGRESRKVIWVEPYWRGPEDAPILARPYKMGDQP